MRASLLAFVAVLVAAFSVGACSRDPVRIGVGAAAVLRHAMPELAKAHRDATGVHVDVIYGASDKLVEQAAAPGALDVLALADASAFGGVNTSAPRQIATTALVLIGPAGAPYRFTNLGDDGVVAIGDPAQVPVGRYARRYLEQLGVWDRVSPRVVLGGDVAGALSLAQRGTAHVAIVYATDAVDAAPLSVLDAALDGPRIELAAATTAHASHPAEAAAFVRFLSTTTAQQILTKHGFSPPGPVITAPKPPPKPPDEMDERMRHCPLAIDGAVSTVEDIDGGVRFTVKVPAPAISEARRRAHHIVEFAAKKTRKGHGGFEGKGGGRMKNCPVVTDAVTITVNDIDGGAQLDVVTEPARVATLRTETGERVTRFPFVGATIKSATAH